MRALKVVKIASSSRWRSLHRGGSADSRRADRRERPPHLPASGMTPEEMSRVVNKQVPTPFKDVDLGSLLRPNYGDFASRALLMPLRVVGLARSLAGRWREVSMMDLITGLAEALPAGLYTGAG